MPCWSTLIAARWLCLMLSYRLSSSHANRKTGPISGEFFQRGIRLEFAVRSPILVCLRRRLSRGRKFGAAVGGPCRFARE
jgi:hypothetical protein